MEELQIITTQLRFANNLWIILLPLILMAVDIITGLIGAWVRNEILSSKLRVGLAKKMGEIFCVLIGELFVAALQLPMAVASAISLYIVLMELISICENLVKLGVPVPKFVKDALAVTSDKIQNE